MKGIAPADESAFTAEAADHLRTPTDMNHSAKTKRSRKIRTATIILLPAYPIQAMANNPSYSLVSL